MVMAMKNAHNCKGTKSVEFTVWQEVDDDTECKPKVGQSEPGEDERENIILQTLSNVN